jgi:hypothetical protein
MAESSYGRRRRRCMSSCLPHGGATIDPMVTRIITEMIELIGGPEKIIANGGNSTIAVTRIETSTAGAIIIARVGMIDPFRYLVLNGVHQKETASAFS